MASIPWARADVSVGELAVVREPISDRLYCSHLDGLFRDDLDMSSAVVVGRDGIRLVNRGAFYQALAGPKGFGWALHHSKPIAWLPDSVWSTLSFDANLSAVDAALEILAADVTTNDDVLVTGGDGIVGTLAVSVLLRALSEHHARQADTLAGSERRFRTLIAQLSEAVVIVDTSGIITYTCPTGLTASGSDPTPPVGASLALAVDPQDLHHFRAAMLRALDSPASPVTTELRMGTGESAGTYEMVIRNLLGEPTVAGIVVNFRDVTHQRELEQQLRHEALHDPLTGLPNRVLLLDRVGRALEHARRTARLVALLYLDLDGFKTINDTLGHSAGDRLLEEIGARLTRSVRPADTLARLGGDEFALLLDELPDVADANDAAARIHACLLEPVMINDQTVRVEASIGVAVVEDPDVGADELLRRADMAMYAAKAQGKNRTVSWSLPLQTALYDDNELRTDLAGAIERNELFVVYQPIVDLSLGTIRGVEALARWRHPLRGVINPDRFIPLAERTGQIARLGRWVLRAACRDVAEWRAQGINLALSVNMSGPELSKADLVNEVQSSLESSGLPPAALEVEVTETALIANLASARRTLDQLKSLGVRVAIDDFGTGYSSLSYLRELPVDTVKIDKSFVDKLGRSVEDTELIGGVIRLAHSIGLSVTAEGIEDKRQAIALRQLGCDLAQGYYYARPLQPDQIAAFLKTVPVEQNTENEHTPLTTFGASAPLIS